MSSATNLVAGKTGLWVDALVYSRSQAQFLAASLAWRMGRTQSVTRNVSLSPDGRWLVVEADQVRLVDLDGAANRVVMPVGLRFPASFSEVGGRLTLSGEVPGKPGRVEVYSVEAILAGQSGLLWGTNAQSGWSTLSAGGEKLTYTEWTGSSYRLSVLDLDTARVVLTRSGVVSTGPGESSFSADSRYVVWEEGASKSQIRLADVETGATSLVSGEYNGQVAGDGDSVFPAISPDGRWVAFASTSGNLVPQGATKGVKQVYVRDTVLGRTFRVSRTSQGVPEAGGSTRPWFSGDGSQLFFVSEAANLLEDDLNGLPDLLSVALADAGEAVVLVEQGGSSAVLLKWGGKPGRSYGVQFKDSLDADWSEMPGTFGSDDSVEMDTSFRSLFFRLVER